MTQHKSVQEQLIRAVSGVAALKVLNLLLVLITGILLARGLGPASYGTYTFILSLITLMGIPTKAGLPTLVVRETAVNQLHREWGRLRGLLTASNTFAISFSVIIFLLAILCVDLWWGAEESAERSAFFWAIFLVPLISFANIRAATLRGLRKIVQGQLPELVISPLVLVILLVIVLFFKGELSLVTAMQMNVIAFLCAFILGTILLIRWIPKEIYTTSPEYEIRAWLTSLGPLSLFTGLQLLDSQLIIILLRGLASSEDVGLFRVAAQGAMLVAFGLSIVNIAISPQIARLYRDGDMQQLQRMITWSTRVVTISSVPAFVAFFLFGEELIRLVFGEVYAGAAPALTIMAFGQVINSSCGSVNSVMNMTGFERETIKAVIASLLGSVLLALVLIPRFGVVGAAVAYSGSLVVWNSILVYKTKRMTGLSTFLF